MEDRNGELLIEILLNNTVQSISTKLYDVLSNKILQGSGTASGTVLHERCSRICGLNPGLIYLQKKLFYTQNFGKF